MALPDGSHMFESNHKIVPSARKYYDNIPSTVLELVYQYNRVPVKVLNTKAKVKFFEPRLCTRFLIYRPGAYTARVANQTPNSVSTGKL